MNEPERGTPEKPELTEKPEKKSEKENGKMSGRQVGRRVFDLLCALSGCFCLLVYLPYFFWHLSKGHAADVIVSLLVFCFVLIPFLFRKALKRLLRKGYPVLKILWCAAMCFYMITFTAFCFLISGYEDVQTADNGKQKIVVVFGCQVNGDGRLSAELSSRLRKAEQVLKDEPDALCIVAGGKGEDEPISEAQAMRVWLVGNAGIDGDRILTEEESTDTAENVKLSLELLKSAGIDPEDCSFICVSSEFHTPRVYLLMKRAGVSDCSTASAVTPIFFNRCVYTVREYMSYVYLLVFG